MGRSKDISGVRFGRLVAMELTGRTTPSGRIWRCACDCGNESEHISAQLLRGGAKSCGCAKREAVSMALTTHGMTDTPTWQSWRSMKSRCDNPSSADYVYYGARGISYCREWRDFEQFLRDMGERPDGLTLDRIENSKHYGPENCRWATPLEQVQNRRKPGDVKERKHYVRNLKVLRGQ